MYCFEMRTAGNCCVALHLMFVAIAFVFCVGWKGLFGAEDGVRVYICNVYYCFQQWHKLSVLPLRVSLLSLISPSL